MAKNSNSIDIFSPAAGDIGTMPSPGSYSRPSTPSVHSPASGMPTVSDSPENAAFSDANLPGPEPTPVSVTEVQFATGVPDMGGEGLFNENMLGGLGKPDRV